LKKRKIYLAGPFFTDAEYAAVESIAKVLRTEYEVFVPMEHFVPDGENMPNDLWGKKVFEIDKEGIDDSDFAVISDYGFTSDAGTAWESGYIYAIGKKSYVISMNKDVSPVHSLMMINGCTKFFNSFDDLWIFLHSSEYKGYNVEVK
jgi:nucleoside 2-deoxyribosyltransferase